MYLNSKVINVGTVGLVTSVNCGLWPVALFTILLQSIGWIGLVIIEL